MDESEIPGSYDLQSARDMLNKLDWELDQFQSTDDRRYLAYHAFNFAVTAWHLTEWVWQEIGGRADIKAKVALEAGAAPEQFQKRQFKVYVQGKHGCGALKYCRLLATAGKHAHVEWEDPTVSAVVSARNPIPELSEIPADQDPLEILAKGWTLKIVTGSDRLSALQVFQQVLHFWTDFIHKHRIG